MTDTPITSESTMPELDTLIDKIEESAIIMDNTFHVAIRKAFERRDVQAIYVFVKSQRDIEAFTSKMAKRLTDYY